MNIKMKNRYEIDWKAYAAKAREMTAEGAVLLKNDKNALPLREGEKLAVFGRIQFDYYKSGTGSGGMINTRYVVGILDALKEENLVLNQELEQVYREWIKDHPFDWGTGWAQEPWSQEEMPLDDEMVKKAAEESDAALIIIGRTAGEDHDTKAEKGSYYLSETEEKMLAQVCTAFAKTECLAPGEVQELCLEVNKNVFASYDDSGVTGHKSCYVLEAGSYQFYVGTDVRSAELIGSMEVNELEVLSQCTEALAPTEEFERLKPAMEEEKLIPSWEKASLRTYDMALRSKEEEKKELPYTGDKGYRLADVYDKKVSMEEFLIQLRDEDLCCLVRGEGMCSPKVTPGTASAFGGVTKSLEDFGIPCGCCADGPSGIRMDCGTYAFALPNGTCMACSFNEELVEQLYEMEGAELRKNRIDILLGPGMIYFAESGMQIEKKIVEKMEKTLL